MKGLTYKKSGVDINQASLFKGKVKELAAGSFSREVLKGIGGFGSLFRLPRAAYKDPVLVASTDGVGTKLKIAQLVHKHDTVGIDLVAMNANDILCVGARPLFFLDYIASSKLQPKVLLEVVRGINNGCLDAGCSLVGGETAQMPGMYQGGDYDLAGFCVGAVERKEIIDGSGIKPGNIVIGLASSGLHSNGFSLVRKVFSEKELRRFSRRLLEPTRIYVRPVLSLLRQVNKSKKQVTGIAHITGGAFYDKIARILPGHLDVNIEKASWEVPEIFKKVQKAGAVPEEEMYRTFNMGIGLVLIVEPEAGYRIRNILARSRMKTWVIGEAVRGKRQVNII